LEKIACLLPPIAIFRPLQSIKENPSTAAIPVLYCQNHQAGACGFLPSLRCTAVVRSRVGRFRAATSRRVFPPPPYLVRSARAAQSTEPAAPRFRPRHLPPYGPVDPSTNYRPWAHNVRRPCNPSWPFLPDDITKENKWL